MNTDNKKTIFRRQMIVNKDIQLHFAFVSLALMVASAVTLWLLMCAFAYFMPIEGADPGALKNYLSNSQTMVVMVILADAVAVFFIAIYFSHQIAGPLYRLERSLTELLETGKTKPVVLRKNDLLQSFAERVNQIIESWPKK